LKGKGKRNRGRATKLRKKKSPVKEKSDPLLKERHDNG